MPKLRKPGVVFQPDTSQGLYRGVHQIVDAIRPTLGPNARVVAVESTSRDKSPELLDCGGLIARRVIQINDRDADVGAMYLRQVLWEIYDEMGDATATAAVLFGSIYDQGLRLVSAGANPMLLQSAFEKGLRVILEELDRMAIPIETQQQLTRIAQSVCYDQPLAEVMGEIFDLISAYGSLRIQGGRGREPVKEFVQGTYWDQGLASKEMLLNIPRQRSDLQDAHLLISDLVLEDQQELIPFLDMAHRNGVHSLLMIAAKFSDPVLGLLNSLPKRADHFRVLAVKTPGLAQTDQIAHMEDLAVLTGGRPVVKATSESLAGVALEDLGQARRVWADMEFFGVIYGKGDPRQVRQQIVKLTAAFRNASEKEPRERAQERVGRLTGGSATIFVGGSTESEIKFRKDLAGRTAQVIRAGLREGALPGGGSALLACIPALQKLLERASEQEEAMAYRILIRALQEPLRAISENAGLSPSEVMIALDQAGPQYGFDVQKQKVVLLGEMVLDVTAALKAAVHGAISGSALLLTTDAIVHKKKPPLTFNP